MGDGCRMIERWTLRSLVGAFLDLAIAYIFLSAAAVAFAASKFFSIFGVDLSCQHHPPFALRPTPTPFIAVCPRPRPPSWEAPSVRSPPKPAILLLHHHNNNNNNNNNNWAEFSESESESAPAETAAPLSYGEFGMEKLKRAAVEEERAARAALSRELEKERSAAASAADEAMAMMLRLQEEKAAVEIEARQYRRMVEEKSAFDDQQIATLQEIILQQETENYALQMELEECQRQMMMMMMMMNNNNNGTNLHSEVAAGIGGRVYDVHVIDDDHQRPSQTESESVSDAEKLLLEKEVVLLRKRLQAIQQGREKLTEAEEKNLI